MGHLIPGGTGFRCTGTSSWCRWRSRFRINWCVRAAGHGAKSKSPALAGCPQRRGVCACGEDADAEEAEFGLRKVAACG
jgi:ribosomal protein S12